MSNSKVRQSEIGARTLASSHPHNSRRVALGNDRQPMGEKRFFLLSSVRPFPFRFVPRPPPSLDFMYCTPVRSVHNKRLDGYVSRENLPCALGVVSARADAAHGTLGPVCWRVEPPLHFCVHVIMLYKDKRPVAIYGVCVCPLSIDKKP